MTGLVRSLLGMGNPLLDIMAEVDQAILDKYDVSTKNHILSVQMGVKPPSVFLTADQLIIRKTKIFFEEAIYGAANNRFLRSMKLQMSCIV